MTAATVILIQNSDRMSTGDVIGSLIVIAVVTLLMFGIWVKAR